MKINISTNFFTVNVLKTESTIDTDVSGKVGAARQIELPDMRGTFAFQPVLQVSLTAPSDPIMIVAVRFVTFKNGEELHRMQTSSRLTKTMLFKADDVADLAPYRARNGMLGVWRFEAGIAILKADILKSSSQEAFADFLASMRYQNLAVFEFEVVRSITISEMNPDGTLTAAARTRRNPDVTISMNDI